MSIAMDTIVVSHKGQISTPREEIITNQRTVAMGHLKHREVQWLRWLNAFIGRSKTILHTHARLMWRIGCSFQLSLLILVRGWSACLVDEMLFFISLEMEIKWKNLVNIWEELNLATFELCSLRSSLLSTSKLWIIETTSRLSWAEAASKFVRLAATCCFHPL